MTNQVTVLQWANAEPYKNIENNPRVRDDEVIMCEGDCGDEAVVVANDGTKGLCQVHYDRWCYAMDAEAERFND